MCPNFPEAGGQFHGPQQGGGKLPPHHLAYLLSDTCDESPLASYIGDATGLSEFMTVFVAESAAFAQDLQFRRFRCSIIVGGPR